MLSFAIVIIIVVIIVLAVKGSPLFPRVVKGGWSKCIMCNGTGDMKVPYFTSTAGFGGWYSRTETCDACKGKGRSKRVEVIKKCDYCKGQGQRTDKKITEKTIAATNKSDIKKVKVKNLETSECIRCGGIGYCKYYYFRRNLFWTVRPYTHDCNETSKDEINLAKRVFFIFT